MASAKANAAAVKADPNEGTDNEAKTDADDQPYSPSVGVMVEDDPDLPDLSGLVGSSGVAGQKEVKLNCPCSLFPICCDTITAAAVCTQRFCHCSSTKSACVGNVLQSEFAHCRCLATQPAQHKLAKNVSTDVDSIPKPYCQVWRGRLHVPGMFRANVAADMVAGTGSIGRMFTSSEVRPLS